MATVSVRNLITDAMLELGVAAAGQPITADQAVTPLSRLNQIFDNWNAQAEASYVIRFDEFVLVPDQGDYTIGSSANAPDFETSHARPVSVLGANLILDDGDTPIRQPITVRDYQWWQDEIVREITSTIPTDLYYAPDWPNGVLHFWPVPTVAYGVEIISNNAFSDGLTLNDELSLPSGYQNAVMLTLAEDIASAFGTQPTPLTTKKAAQARARIFRNNVLSPRIATYDAGMEGPRGGARPSFNWLTGVDT